MPTENAPPNTATPIGYGTSRTQWRKRAWRILRPAIFVLIPFIIYGVTYIAFRRVTYTWGGGVVVQYPGVTRFYALTLRLSYKLGHSDELIESHADAGGSSRQLSDSVLLLKAGRWHHMWRIFYAAERVEFALRGDQPLKINYSGPVLTNSSPTAAAPSTLPLLGAVYQECYVRDKKIYRFIQGVYGARNRINVMERRNDIYLLEWPTDGAWDQTPRSASVRLVETSSRAAWEPHWLVDHDHFVTWNENTGQAKVFTCTDAGPASVTATIAGLRPVRCNRVSPISVSAAGKFIAAEKDGLTIFQADTLRPAVRIPESDSLSRFFAKRTDELDEHNSLCYVMDDGVTLLRVVTIFKASGDGFVNGTIVVVINSGTGEVRDIPIKLGARADVHNAALIDGKLLLYVIYTEGDSRWKQCLFEPDSQRVVALHPENSQPDSVAMYWDPTGELLVDIPGFAANPQPLVQDAEICIENPALGSRTLGRIRYGDVGGNPKLFQPGLMKFAW